MDASTIKQNKFADYMEALGNCCADHVLVDLTY